MFVSLVLFQYSRLGYGYSPPQVLPRTRTT